mmetsp:Transcript_24777/g.30465  ORF Transcript_24777/g.30465 Transcript_24777/m.30465 type:complete len:480 (-) Transcript_24777:1048-2487(-)
MTILSIRCHYEILNVPRDADEKAIKKAYHKLALKFHPDKNNNCEEAAKEFCLVQQAYECLSDASERKWYDEHREAILKGWKGVGDESGGDMESSFIFDLTPFHFSGCYDGYSDGEGGYFEVYRHVFQKIMEGERNGWIDEGKIDETEMTNSHLPLDFGCGSTEWKDVSLFYNSWESFSSCLSYAFADKYDIKYADSRWERRKVDEENRKARKIAKKERNDEVIDFVAFVKKRDPRVKAAREQAEEIKILREIMKKEEQKRKKSEAAALRESWLREREQEMREAEVDDLNAGRIRLADLSDSDDEYYRRRGKSKKGKKKNKRNIKVQSSSDEDESGQGIEKQQGVEENLSADEEAKNSGIDNIWKNRIFPKNDYTTINNETSDVDHAVGNEILVDELLCDEESSEESSEPDHTVDNEILVDELLYDEDYDEESSEEESEPEIFKCACCRKTFKSENQLGNHEKSKKHKEAFKKWKKTQIG